MTSALSEVLTSTATTDVVSVPAFIVCIIAALLMGVLFSLSIQFKSFVSKSFAVTVAILPPVVCVVIMMVNGSIGAGIAVAGTFSLVRFRSVPGTAREIVAVFIAMAVGLACGMGNLVYGFVFIVLTIIGMMLLEHSKFGEMGNKAKHKVLRITIPEDIDYTEIFEDVFDSYLKHRKLISVKTTNLGSMFKLTYHIELMDPYEEKALIDQLRVRNGNLEISCSMMSTVNNEL